VSLEVRNERDIKGITLNKEEIKESIFADDATFLTDGTEASFNKLVQTIDDFSHVSGLKLNTKKSTILRAGSLRNTEKIYCKMKSFIWTSQEAKTLGIIFTNNISDRISINLDNKIEEMYSCLNKWKKHNLTLLGKITVIKTFALPKIIYPLTVLENPKENVFSEITKNMYSFLWNGKPDKIARTTIKRQYDEGGLKMVDINAYINSIKAAWVKRILNPANKGHWKETYLRQINKYGGKLLFEYNISTKHVALKIENKCHFKGNIME